MLPCAASTRAAVDWTPPPYEKTRCGWECCILSLLSIFLQKCSARCCWQQERRSTANDRVVVAMDLLQRFLIKRFKLSESGKTIAPLSVDHDTKIRWHNDLAHGVVQDGDAPAPL